MATKGTAKPARNAHTHHPLFPGRDGITSLYVYRIITGARGREVPELLAGPLDPASLTTDAQLADFGPGLVRVVPRGAGGVVLGEPHNVMFRDSATNRVPLSREDFETADVPASSDTQWHKLLAEQREETKRVISEMREAHKADLASFGSLLDKQSEGFATITERFMNAALSMAQGGPKGAGDSSALELLREQTKELREELKATRARADEMSAELARLKNAGSELSDSGLLKLALEEGLPMLRAEMERRNRRPAAPPALPAAVASSAVVIEGHELPDVERLRDAISRRGADALKPGAVELFRDLHSRGMLPKAYVDVLASLLAE